jgi:hypothetical protein
MSDSHDHQVMGHVETFSGAPAPSEVALSSELQPPGIQPSARRRSANRDNQNEPGSFLEASIHTV